jgi:hypothetical protein
VSAARQALDSREVSDLLALVAAAINSNGIHDIGCFVLNEKDRLDVHMVCMKGDDPLNYNYSYSLA